MELIYRVRPGRQHHRQREAKPHSHVLTIDIGLILHIQLLLRLRIDQLVNARVVVNLPILQLAHDFALHAFLELADDLPNPVVFALALLFNLHARLRHRGVLEHWTGALAASLGFNNWVLQRLELLLDWDSYGFRLGGVAFIIAIAILTICAIVVIISICGALAILCI